MSRILVIDDEADVRQLVTALLERAGHDVIEAANGPDGLRALFRRPPDLILLDVSMPGMDGWQVLARIRDLTDVPVLMLTAAASEMEKVRGLQAGADDFVTKPFGRQELLARIEAVSRRAPARVAVADRYEDGLVMVDFRQRLASVAGRELRLTPLEFRLLAAFVRNADQVLSREQLLEAAWGHSATALDQVKLYVSYLRRKLRDAGAPQSVIETVRGFGYRFNTRRDDSPR